MYHLAGTYHRATSLILRVYECMV